MSKGTINKVILVGRLGKDPEGAPTKDGSSYVTRLSLATVDGYKDKEHTEWHRVTMFGKMAEAAAKYLSKGAKVYIEGLIRTQKYTDKEGAERESKEIIASDMQFLGGNEERSEQPQANAKPTAAPAPAYDNLDDGIPF